MESNLKILDFEKALSLLNDEELLVGLSQKFYSTTLEPSLQ